MRDLTGVEIGTELFRVDHHLTRDDLVRYAGASGDFNPIHYNESAAAASGLPDVIAHGMLTMGLAASALEEWVGDPREIRSIDVRFSGMVVVPHPQGVDVTVVGTLKAVKDDVAKIDLTVECLGEPVLSRSVAEVAVGGPTRQ